VVEKTADANVDFVLEQIETMVASEGGSLELVSLDDGSLKVRYTPGFNEDCPECVPTADQVSQFLTVSLSIHAPHITDIQLAEA